MYNVGAGGAYALGQYWILPKEGSDKKIKICPPAEINPLHAAEY